MITVTMELEEWQTILEVMRHILHIHEPNDSAYCVECGHAWPCQTQRAVRVYAENERYNMKVLKNGRP